MLIVNMQRGINKHVNMPFLCQFLPNSTISGVDFVITAAKM